VTRQSAAELEEQVRLPSALLVDAELRDARLSGVFASRSVRGGGSLGGAAVGLVSAAPDDHGSDQKQGKERE